jgi:hypothetical protein
MLYILQKPPLREGLSTYTLVLTTKFILLYPIPPFFPQESSTVRLLDHCTVHFSALVLVRTDRGQWPQDLSQR